MNSPTVLHLCSIKGRGGTGYMASRLARLCAEQGARVIVGACPGSKMEERAREAGLEVLEGLRLRRGFRPRSLAGDLRRIRRCLREEGVEIVHTWHSIEYWTGALATLGTPAHLVRTRGLTTPVRGSVVNRLIHDRTAFVHVTCRAIWENYRAAGLDLERVLLVPDGVDLERFHPRVRGEALRREVGLPPEAVVVASIGRLEPVKGHEHLLAALASLAVDLPRLHVLVAGDGSLRNGLEAQARRDGLGRRVHFLGVRSDIPTVLAASDIFALASVGSEGSSRATLEAMAAGLPVVASEVGMLPDLVEPGLSGYLVPPRDPPSLAGRLRQLAESPGLCAAMGLNARVRAEQHFDEVRFAERILAAYDRVRRDEPPVPPEAVPPSGADEEEADSEEPPESDVLPAEGA
jgi:glycosyltransferase involved in cell wall biosynthesis